MTKRKSEGLWMNKSTGSLYYVDTFEGHAHLISLNFTFDKIIAEEELRKFYKKQR
tara:strand:+ start:3914 stop:4078 length:165 start_codon:yes stop_codon:yes gene_type:complete